LAWYFAYLDTHARPYLQPNARVWFEQLFNPTSPAYLLDQPDFYVIYMDLLARGVKRQHCR
jgi:hypothetical protein